MNSGLRGGLAVAALAGMAACGGGDASGEWGGTVADSAGITVVHNPQDGLWAEGTGWGTEEVFRAGGIDAAVEGQLGLVLSIDVDDAGRVYAADQQARQIVVFDADGTPLRRIGEPGNGPGEFGMQMGGVFIDGETLYSPDITQGRVNVFDTAGAPQSSSPLDLSDGIPFRWDMDGQGRLIAQLRAFNPQGAPADSDDLIVDMTPGAEERTTLASLAMGEGFSISERGMEMVIFAPEVIWDMAESGAIAEARNNVFEVRIWEDGSLQRLITLPRQAAEVTEMEERRIRTTMRQFMLDMGAPPEAIQPLMDGMDFAENYPAFAQLLLQEDGSLLVQRITTARDAGEDSDWSIEDIGSDTWDVFDAEGRYLGAIQFPLHFTPVRSKNGVIWGVQRDELDVQSVVGVRLVEG